MINMIGIVPQNYLGLIRNDSMHMVLAQLLGAPGMEAYTRFYTEEVKYYAYTILDNGAAEGTPMPIEELVKKAELLHASEVILPDAYMDCEQTLKWHADALENMRNYYGDYQEIPFNLMIVPQGKTEEEWLACAKSLILKYGDVVQTIGIPKHLIKTLDNRDARLGVISKLHQDPEIDLAEFNIHLLGCWKTPLEVLTIAKVAKQEDIPPIRSCDSAIPYVYAKHNKRFEDDDRPDFDPIDFCNGTCDTQQLEINLQDWRNIGNLTTNNIIYM